MSLHLDRRDFLRLASAGAAAGALACSSPEPESTETKQPNLVLIMADDMGYSDIGCYGGEVSTPVIDSLAEGGLRFRQFYNGARCCPTRASLLTGLYAHQTGVGHMMEQHAKDGEPIPSYQGRINDRCVTIAEALKPAGYTTLMSGKWHVTPAVDRSEGEPKDKSNWPRQRGFDHFWGTIHGAGSFYNPYSLTDENTPTKPTDTNFYYTTEIAKHAVEFLAGAPTDKPFFLYMPFTSPHWPLHAPEEDVEPYYGRYDAGWDALREERHGRMKEMGIVDAKWELTPRDAEVPPWDEAENKEWEARRMEVYAAQISIMDRAIGSVVDQLKAMGAYEDTLILFLADNGGCAEKLGPNGRGFHFTKETVDGRPVKLGNDPSETPGQDDDYQSYGPPWANASNTPFRLYKHWVHEGGISSPLIAHWPNGLEAKGEWTDTPAHLIDVMATFVDVGAAEYPAELNGTPIQPMEGVSLAPVFRKSALERNEAIYWEHEGNRAIRDGKWKLVSKFRPPEEGRWELYDLEADRTEMHNLAEAEPERVEQMSARWQAWADRVGVVEWQSWDREGA